MDIRIVNIAELPRLTHLNRWELLRYGSQPADIDVNLRTHLEQNLADSRVTLRVEVVYTYMRAMIKRPLLHLAAEAVFEIVGLERYMMPTADRESIDMPPSLMQLMLSVAIGAIRGMIAQKTVGTSLQSHPMPLIDISKLVSRLIYGTPAPQGTIPLGAAVCR